HRRLRPKMSRTCRSQRSRSSSGSRPCSRTPAVLARAIKSPAMPRRPLRPRPLPPPRAPPQTAAVLRRRRPQRPAPTSRVRRRARLQPSATAARPPRTSREARHGLAKGDDRVTSVLPDQPFGLAARRAKPWVEEGGHSMRSLAYFIGTFAVALLLGIGSAWYLIEEI